MNVFQNIWYWRLAIFECLTDAFTAGAMVWMASVADKEWQDISPTGRNIIWVSATVAVLKVVKSFLSNTMAILKAARPIILDEPQKLIAHSEEIKPTADGSTRTTEDKFVPIK